MNSMGNGVGYFTRGVRLLRHPKLAPFVFIPLMVNIGIFGGFIYYGFGFLSDTLNDWVAAIPLWLAWLSWFVSPLAVLTLALVTGYLFTAVAILIASPFNSLLAEKAEEVITGEAVAGAGSIAAALVTFPLAIAQELKKFAYYLLLLLVVLILSWIPPISVVAPVLWFLFGAWTMAIQYADYPMDNHEINFSTVRARLKSKPLSSLGFGGAVALATGIPLLNFFVVPSAVCGATIFWCEELRE